MLHHSISLITVNKLHFPINCAIMVLHQSMTYYERGLIGIDHGIDGDLVMQADDHTHGRV